MGFVVAMTGDYDGYGCEIILTEGELGISVAIVKVLEIN